MIENKAVLEELFVLVDELNQVSEAISRTIVLRDLAIRNVSIKGVDDFEDAIEHCKEAVTHQNSLEWLSEKREQILGSIQVRKAECNL